MKTISFCLNFMGGAFVALGLSLSAAQAGTYKLDFTGTATAGTGAYDIAVTDDLVTGTIAFSDTLNFVTSATPNAIDATSTDRSVSVSGVNPTSTGFISIEVKYGTTTTSRSSTSLFGSLNIISTDPGVPGADDFFEVFAGTVSSGGLIDIGLSGDDLVGGDPSQGISRDLLESLNAANADGQNEGRVRNFGGELDFTITSFTLTDYPDKQDMTPVPLPAGLPLLFGGMLVLGALRISRKGTKGCNRH